MQSQSDLSEHVNPRPTVSCLWQEDFTSTIQIPLQTNLHLLKSLGLFTSCAHRDRHSVGVYALKVKLFLVKYT